MSHIACRTSSYIHIVTADQTCWIWPYIKYLILDLKKGTPFHMFYVIWALPYSLYPFINQSNDLYVYIHLSSYVLSFLILLKSFLYFPQIQVLQFLRPEPQVRLQPDQPDLRTGQVTNKQPTNKDKKASSQWATGC